MLSKEMVACLACGVCLMTIAMLTGGVIASDESCAEMEFEGLSQEVTVRVEENTYVNVTFYLNTSKCPEDRNSFQIRVRESRGLLSVIVCIIVVEKTTCRVTMSSERCQCLPDTESWMRMFHLMTGTGLVSCTWRWGGLNFSESDEKASINFDVFSTDTTAEPSSTPTEGQEDKPIVASGTVTTRTAVRVTPNGDEPQNEGDNFQVIFFTSIITALVIGVPLVTGIVIYVYRAKKRRKGRTILSTLTVNNNSFTFHISGELPSKGHDIQTSEHQHPQKIAER